MSRPRLIDGHQSASTANKSVKIGPVWEEIRSIVMARNAERRSKRLKTPRVTTGQLVAEALDGFLPHPESACPQSPPVITATKIGDEKTRSCNLPRSIHERLAWTAAHWGYHHDILVAEALIRWLAILKS